MSVGALTSLVTALVILSLPASSSSRTLPVPDRAVQGKAEVKTAATAGVRQEKAVSKSQRRTLRSLAVRIGNVRAATWDCQDTLDVNRAKASVSVWALPQSIAYRKWVMGRWVERFKLCQQQLDHRTIPDTGDWLTAVDAVQRIYPGTKDWLLFISHREGGWGRFVMNTQGSGAGGNMQFMASTYWAYSYRAYEDVARRGFIIDPRTNDWHSPLGQAITAAYMRFTHQDGCHWCLG